MSLQWLNSGTSTPTLASAFSKEDIDYCQALSRVLLTSKPIKEYPDLVALAYWLRRSNIESLLAPYIQKSLMHIPVGTVFHSAPANVDSLFAYSSIVSLLCGNINIIRLSSRSGKSTDLLVAAISSLSDEYPMQNARMQLLQCKQGASELKLIVSKVDARVLWGSDASILAQRQWPMLAYARDICFGHKYSLCALDASTVLEASHEQIGRLVNDFIRDNLTFAQQACSSAKAIIWVGNTSDITLAQDKFWQYFRMSSLDKLRFSWRENYDAFDAAQQLSILDDSIVAYCQQGECVRLAAHQLTENQVNMHCGNGIFIEINLERLSKLLPMLQPYHQTLSCWGFDDEQIKWLRQQACLGMDRIVSVGESLQFDLIWDGQDLIHSFSRLRR